MTCQTLGHLHIFPSRRGDLIVKDGGGMDIKRDFSAVMELRPAGGRGGLRAAVTLPREP